MKLGIITGSMREGRVSGHIASVVVERAKSVDGVEVVELDLKELNLPFFDEAISPKYNPDRSVTGPAKTWLDALADVDAVVVVSPEYNRSISGVLKNAFDFIAHEVKHKPFGLVSHGSYGGAYALSQLRTIVPELGGVTIPRFVSIPYGRFDADGNMNEGSEETKSHIDGLLEELRAYSDALADLRK